MLEIRTTNFRMSRMLLFNALFLSPDLTVEFMRHVIRALWGVHPMLAWGNLRRRQNSIHYKRGECKADRTGAWAPPGFGWGKTSGPGGIVDFTEAVFIVGSAVVEGLLKGRIGKQQPVEFDPFPHIHRRNFGFSQLVFHGFRFSPQPHI